MVYNLRTKGVKGEIQMKRWKQMMLILFESLLIIGGAAVWKQKGNIQAVYEGMSYNQEELAHQIQSTKEEVDKVLEKYDLQHIRRLTPEEESQVKKGEISIEEAMERMIPVGDKEVLATEKVEAVVEKPQVIPKQESDIVKTYTAKMYELQAKYLGLLGGLEASGIQALKAIPSDQRTVKKMMNIGMPFVQKGLALESQCDGEVENVLHNLKKELVAIGAEYEGAMTKEMTKMPKKDRKKLLSKNNNSIATYIASELEKLGIVEVRTTIAGHTQRGGEPTPYDRILSTRFGAKGAELIISKNYGNLVVFKDNEISYIPLSETAGKLKAIDDNSPIIKECENLGISFCD